MIILIPAYEPDHQLSALILAIRDAEPAVAVVVVDDGSGPAYKDVFDGVRNLGCHVIGYTRNRGKGFALKTGFGFIADHLPGQDIVCADSDGQHTIVDIRPVADSVRIYAPLLKFLASSFSAFLVDTVAFLLLTLVTDSLLGAVLGARAVSSAVNFLVNRRLVFNHGRDRPVSAAGLRYFSLVAVLLAANYGLLSVPGALSVAALPAKILTEIVLLTVSSAMQQRYLFAANPAGTFGQKAHGQTPEEVTSGRAVP